MKYMVCAFIVFSTTFGQPETIAKAKPEKLQTPLRVNVYHYGNGNPPLWMKSGYRRPQ
jgi:hypothetical protein